MIRPVRKQSGSVLLTLMLVIVVAASFTLVSKLNASSRTYIRQQSTMDALNRAKVALIAYAVTYPEQSGTSDPAAGPGYIPCPDTNFPPDGSPNPFINNCNETIDRYTGRFPDEFLGVGDLVDDSGERIWYAISDNFRNIGNKFSPINSDTPGGLSIDINNDGAGDIEVVAVLIAPGTPVDTIAQNRPSNLITDYLEGENADGDPVFAQKSGGGNDILVYITKQELMRAVEKRISGDTVNALKSYQTDTGVFPWLALFNPATVDYDAVAGTREGSLAYNDINEVFPTQFSVSWDIRDPPGPPFTMTPTPTMPDWNSFAPITVGEATPISTSGSPECTWTARDVINCNGRYTDPTAIPISDNSPWPWVNSGSAARTYDFTLSIPAGGNVDIPTGTNSVRTRTVSVNALAPADFPAGTSVTVQITDTGQYDTTCLFGIPLFCFPMAPILYSDSQTNTITTATDGDIAVAGITYDLGVGDEIPQWLVANNWHKYIYAAYSTADVPDTAPPCVQGTDCLTMLNTGPVSNDKQAIIVMAGPELPALGQDRSVSDALNAYFENNNIDTDPGIPDDVFERNILTATFNDQARTVAP